jgi:hypothetical protein
MPASRAGRSPDALSILLLCDDRPSHAPNVLEHIHAFQRFSRHRVDPFNPRGIDRSRFLRFDDYDVVVVHYTIPLHLPVYLSEWFRDRIAAFRGLKAQFIQDEYRRVDAATAQMRRLGIDLLFSSVPADAVPGVYGSRLPGVDILPTLTGFVPADLGGRPRQPLVDRPLDVVYRGRSIPYWLGRLGQDKALIGQRFLARSQSTGLRCDIAWTEADRVYGEDWYRFLASSRSTLGTESGASIVDFDGTLQERTEAYLAAHPGATFDEVERELLAPFEGNAVIEAISPRVFEAASLGTAMVNFPGRYSDVIEPWLHYIPLEKDFSNFDEVVCAIGEDAVLEGLTSRAHADLVASGRYSLDSFVQGFDREIESRVGRVGRRQQSRVAHELNRRLRGLEHLRSASRVAELPFVAAQRARAVERAGSRLIRRFPEIEALEHPEIEERGRERLHDDLVRLAAAAAAHLRELRYLGRPFDVGVELSDQDRRLTLVGAPVPVQDASERREIGERAATAIRDGRLEEIVWNNSAVGGIAFMSFPLASLDIGYHVTGATHRFNVLIELARSEPEAVISALDLLFRPRPDGPVHELDHRTATLIRVLWLSPGRSAAQATAALRAVLTSKELRRVLRAYLASPDTRAEAPMDVVLKDLFRLWLVGQTRTKLELDDAGEVLVYRTEPDASTNGIVLEPATVQSLRRIVWDHSQGGDAVTSTTRPRVSITLEGGVHDFEALAIVAQHFPALAAPALRRAAAGEGWTGSP